VTESENRKLMRCVREACAVHVSPILALVGPGRWQIVDGAGAALGDAGPTPLAAWESAAKRVWAEQPAEGK
jgi:hypothetical protein